MTNTVRIQVLIDRTTASGVSFCDALYYTSDEYAALKPEEIAAAADARFAAFEEAIAPKEDKRSEDEIRDSEIDALTQEKADYAAKLALVEETLDAKMAEKGK